MAKKVTYADFSKTIKSLLSEYGDDVKNNVTEAAQKVTKEGVRRLKSESRDTFGTVKKRKKKYANTWTSTFVTGRTSSQGTIYNTQAGLPHLLENGHVSRNGTGRTYGKVSGRTHIATVEKEIETIFEREVTSKL